MLFWVVGWVVATSDFAKKQVVDMVEKVGGTTNDDTGPVSFGPNAFWAELQIDSFFKYVEISLMGWKRQFSWQTIGGNGEIGVNNTFGRKITNFG